MLVSFFERFLALILFIFLSPLLFLLYFLVKFDSSGPFLFQQKRAGKDKKPFTIYKIRTMINGAEKIQKKIKNEADGPVFKNYHDPRFTKIGRIISYLGLDEIPQLINIIKNEMSFVGPRPFPLEEAEKIPKKYEKRFSVKPGIFSSWVAAGAFHNDFNRWMMMDLNDIDKKNLIYDLKIILNSIRFVIKLTSCLKSNKG